MKQRKLQSDGTSGYETIPAQVETVKALPRATRRLLLAYVDWMDDPKTPTVVFFKDCRAVRDALGMKG